MRIYVDRERCLRNEAVCDQCFGRMVRREEWPDRACVLFTQDDQREAPTFVFPSARGYVEVELNADTRERLAWEGWAWALSEAWM